VLVDQPRFDRREFKMTEYAVRILLDIAFQTVKPYLDLIV
jgi:hypothetical protein